MEQNTLRSTAKLSMLYFFAYCPLGVVCPLIGQYLDEIGFSGTQVGIITSLGTATAFFAGLFWGQVYSNTRRKRMVLAAMCLCAALLGVAGTGTRVFLIYAVIYSGMYFFQAPLHGLCDSLVLSEGGNFPVVRAMGAIGFAAAVFVAGRYAENTSLENIFYIYAAAYIVTAVLVFMQKEPPYYKEDGEKISITVLLENKDYLKLVAAAFFVIGTNTANNTYFGFLFREGGGNVSGIGLAFLLMAGSEAPFMILLPGLMKKYRSEKLILFAIVLSALRFGFFAMGPSSDLLLKTFFLQGIVNGILLVEVVKYVDRLAGPKFSTAAIPVYYAVANNLSAILCSLLGGIILDYAGARGVYAFMGLWNVISAVLFVSFGLHKKHQKQ